jgi:hypothetical protein
MRHVWYIATKELLQNRRDRLAALFTLVLPVIFTVVLGLIIGTAEGSRLPLALADADGSPTAQRLVEQLKASSLLEVKTMAPAEVDKAVHDQKAAAGLVIPAGFGTTVEAGEPLALAFVRVETSTGAQSVRQAVQEAVSRLDVGMLAAQTAAEQIALATGATLDEALLASARSMVDAQLAEPPVTIEIVGSGSSIDSHAGGFDQSSSGSLVNWVLFSLLGVAAPGTPPPPQRRGGARPRDHRGQDACHGDHHLPPATAAGPAGSTGLRSGLLQQPSCSTRHNAVALSTGRGLRPAHLHGLSLGAGRHCDHRHLRPDACRSRRSLVPP